MVEIRGFQPPDLMLLDLQPDQQAEMDAAGDWRSGGLAILRHGPAWTGLLDGRVIGCAGLNRMWTGRATTWCLLARDIPKPAWIGIHRATRARLAEWQAASFHRIEAETAYGWPPGERWLRMLGFEYEAHARAFGPDGRDFSRWARIAS